MSGWQFRKEVAVAVAAAMMEVFSQTGIREQNQRKNHIMKPYHGLLNEFIKEWEEAQTHLIPLL